VLIGLNVMLYPFLPTSFSILISIGMSLLMLYRMFKLDHIQHQSKPLIFSGWLFILYLFISLLFNEVISDGVLVFINYFSVTLFMIAIVGFLKSKIALMNLIHLIAGLVFVLSLHGMYQYMVGVPVDPAWLDESTGGNVTRIYSVFGNPNVFGEFLVLTLPIIFAGANIQKKKALKAIYSLVFVLGSLNVFLTFSRGAMLSFAIVIALMIVIWDKKYLPFLVMLLLVSPFILPASVFARILTVFQGGDTSTSYRMSIYMASLDMLHDYPIVGVGLGNFKELYKIYAYTAAKSFHAHNTPLMVMIELGIVGFIAWLYMMVIWFRQVMSVQKFKSCWSYYSFAAFAGVLGCSIQGLVDHVWHNSDILFFYFFMMGIGYLSANAAKGENN